MRRFFLTIVILLILARPARGAEFNGRVVEEASRGGISDLTVRLIPPKARNQPEKVTTTNEGGEFHFPELEKGRYLLEIYQGTTLLYREVIEADSQTTKEIRLARKER